MMHSDPALVTPAHSLRILIQECRDFGNREVGDVLILQHVEVGFPFVISAVSHARTHFLLTFEQILFSGVL